MKVKHLMLSSVLAIPALLLPLASCDDSKNPTEPAVNDPAVSDAPSFTAVGFGTHDPRSQSGPRVKVFDGTTDTKTGAAGNCNAPADPPRLCDYTGSAKRFKTKDGAELSTMGTNGTDGSYAGLYPEVNRIKGKLLTQVHELDFSYAGGPHVGGVPRLSIPIDCGRPYDGEGTAACATDGKYDHFAFIDAPGCNDGDEFVGTVAADDNPKCNVNYDSVDYPNWDALVAAHPGARIATDQITFLIIDRAGGDNNFGSHYVIWRVDIR